MNPRALISRAVLEHLAARYAKRRAGRTGEGMQRVLFDYEAILRAAGSADGNARAKAEEQLAEAARSGWIVLHCHRRDATLIHQIEFLPEGEVPMFASLAAKSPAERRRDWQVLFHAAAGYAVPDEWGEAWRVWCGSRGEAASRGEISAPFRWEEETDGAELLRVLAGVFSWNGESLIRFASCVLCGDSKRLEQLAPRLEMALAQITGRESAMLGEFGILRNPRTVLVHGSLRLEFADGTLDLGLLAAPAWISEADILRARAIHSAAPRCLTVENETTMQELAKQQSGTLLIHTSYPSSAVLALMARLPADMDFWHFGDTDPWGFAILRDLREKTRRPIRPLHMQFRPSPASLLNTDERRLLERLLTDPLMEDVCSDITAILSAGTKGEFEQESLGFPGLAWPFYPK